MHPIDRVCCASVIGFQERPPSVLFQTPPPAAATYRILGFTGSAATPATRPLSIWPNSSNAAGPIAGQVVEDSCGTPPPVGGLGIAEGFRGVGWGGGFGSVCPVTCADGAELFVAESKAVTV